MHTERNRRPQGWGAGHQAFSGSPEKKESEIVTRARALAKTEGKSLKELFANPSTNARSLLMDVRTSADQAALDRALQSE